MRGKRVASFDGGEFHSKYSSCVGRIAEPIDPAVDL